MKKLSKHTLAIAVGATVMGVISASANIVPYYNVTPTVTAHSISPTFVASVVYGGNKFSLYAQAGGGDSAWLSDEDWAIAHGGYLAVLPTAASITAVYNGLIGNSFFTAVNGQANEAYLGAVPADGSDSTTSSLNWAWVNGTAWSTADADNFNAGEPNGDSSGLAINRYGTSTFNDEGGIVGGFITENVPDGGSTFMLLGSVMGLVGVIRRKLQK